jgi:hypothetical protein
MMCSVSPTCRILAAAASCIRWRLRRPATPGNTKSGCAKMLPANGSFMIS